MLWRNHVVSCEEIKLCTIFLLNVMMETGKRKFLLIMEVKLEDKVLNVTNTKYDCYGRTLNPYIFKSLKISLT